MKYFLLLILFIGSSAMACVDIGGKYLINDKFVIEYAQNGCSSLTEKWCATDGNNCGSSDGSGTTWLLDGVMRTEGGNPSHWAALSVDANSVHRVNSVDSGTMFEGQLCWWKELWYSKDRIGNLNVAFDLSCPNKVGGFDVKKISQVWAIFK